MNHFSSLTQKLAACRNFAEIAQLATVFDFTDKHFPAAILASIDADAHVRELGRYGIIGPSPSKRSFSLSSHGLITAVIQGGKAALLTGIQDRALKNELTPDSDLDDMVKLNGFKTAYVIPLFDQGYLYGALGFLTTETLDVPPSFLVEEKDFQALFCMAVRAVAYRNPDKAKREKEEIANLTVRERTVLALLAQDKSNLEIAADLSISLSTAKVDVSEVMRKLRVESRKQAGIKARYSGLA